MKPSEDVRFNIMVILSIILRAATTKYRRGKDYKERNMDGIELAS